MNKEDELIKYLEGLSKDEIIGITIREFNENRYFREVKIGEYLKEIEILKQENEKLNHYKLLYQKVKERNEKAIEYIEDRYDYEQKTITHTFDKSNVWELLDILEGNNEIQ